MRTAAYSGVRLFKQRHAWYVGWRRKALLVWYGALGIAVFFALNWFYQVARKPGEILAPVSGALAKSPESTWESYGAMFEKYSTSIITPEFLAALAQVEGSGNPIASTYWSWQWSWNPFEIYRPASSAVGMFQITDGTFAAARKYCVRDHKVVSDGPWYDISACWFNSLYARTLPSHAAELTAAYLHQGVIDALAPPRTSKASLAQKLKLAAVIHLCGAKRGQNFAARGFRITPDERCGTHSLQRYLAQVESLRKRFVRLRAGT